MDPFIINLSGEVKHSITIDPTAWIFDHRKFNLDEYFLGFHDNKKDVSQENNAGPRRFQTNQIRTKKEASIEGSYGIILEPFIENAEPLPSADRLIAITSDDKEVSAPLADGKAWIACFSSSEGKALKEDGPIHIYFPDGSNRHSPITNVVKLRVD
ncbi:hypothetical protein HNR44_001378 [Geomicrobium halophilum]|uniref:Peptidyl-prolyl cis-trans isomerase n=1 Tax=Geomicrobium halophilum TaxID=549000 RepID=A0A841PL04_9BACL|nr:peptidyl-prolyl cis-trans isomerase [Geomicrobium halophilum]MBB6449429.1 hypothetical protein [Geomicrobium halophilum]